MSEPVANRCNCHTPRITHGLSKGAPQHGQWPQQQQQQQQQQQGQDLLGMVQRGPPAYGSQGHASLRCPVLACAVLSCAVLCYDVLSFAILCCPVLSCAVLCCAVLSCALLCSPALSYAMLPPRPKAEAPGRRRIWEGSLCDEPSGTSESARQGGGALYVYIQSYSIPMCLRVHVCIYMYIYIYIYTHTYM